MFSQLPIVILYNYTELKAVTAIKEILLVSDAWIGETVDARGWW